MSLFPAPSDASKDQGVDPEISRPQALPSVEDPSQEVVQRLADHAPRKSRYVQRGEVARGGMGLVLKVWDQDLRRQLAMKVVLGKKGGARAQEADPKTLGRFLEEAQVTAQLEHPAIVPVHELGLDEEGRVYFTMQLVRGRNLGQIFALVKEEKEGWTQTRALLVILQVCDAMAYSHAKGVIHRDLKPDNVMVGRFGEVYVMDWGLARVLGRQDLHDIRIKRDPSTLSFVASDRRAGAQTSSDSALYTMDGDVVGTPSYMSPEQARGQVELLGPRSDVYSVGAMLYQLLTGEAPYVPAGSKVNAHLVLRWLLEGPPQPLDAHDSKVAPELAAICEKAMARLPETRYADMSELAEDLRAYLERRVVKAYEAGASAEFRKWIARNKSTAAAGAGALLIALGGLGSVGYLQAKGKQAERDLRRTAEENAEEARLERAKVLRLSAFQILEDLEKEAESLWPAGPALIPAYEGWLARAEELVAGLHGNASRDDIGHYRTLEELRARALPRTPEVHEADRNAQPRFADLDDAWWHGQLEKLVRGIEAFADPETGLVRGTSERWGWGIERRLALARTIEEESVSSATASELWTQARASIANEAECPSYAGLALHPQRGLLPLGRDPSSGLWEFTHLPSGTPPLRAANGKLALTETTGLVFVLLPGGTFRMGAQRDDPAAANYDPDAETRDGPVHQVVLAPFFLSKYEMTQGQWKAFTARNPSNYYPGGLEESVDFTNPVEHVSWSESVAILSRMGLALPTEAQWEYAARGGMQAPWWTGDEKESIEGAANVADATAHARGTGWKPYEEWLDDGYSMHAPVGSYDANPFGLFDVHGNLWEWCRDSFGDYGLPVTGADAERQSDSVTHPLRGGAFNTAAVSARSAGRQSATPELRVMSIGLRPARPIE